MLVIDLLVLAATSVGQTEHELLDDGFHLDDTLFDLVELVPLLVQGFDLRAGVVGVRRVVFLVVVFENTILK